jgi:hypothetical protein
MIFLAFLASVLFGKDEHQEGDMAVEIFCFFAIIALIPLILAAIGALLHVNVFTASA